MRVIPGGNMRKCPYCAEEIEEKASECNHCGRWLAGDRDPPYLATLPPPPAAAPSYVEPRAGSTSNARPSVPRTRRVLLLAALGLVLVAGGVAIMLLRDGSVSLPMSIDGVPRLTNDEARSTADQFENAMEAIGGKARMASYGYGSTLSFVVVVYQEPTEVGFDQEFRAFSFGYMGASGVDLDPASVVEETYAGVHYRCQSDVEESISVCVMGEGRNYTGLALLESGGSDAALALARKVQAATAAVTL
jgi:hypothetical protein